MPKHACARLTPPDLCARNLIKGPGRRTPLPKVTPHYMSSWQCSPGAGPALGPEGSVPWGLAEEGEGSPVFGIRFLSSTSQGVGEVHVSMPS